MQTEPKGKQVTTPLWLKRILLSDYEGKQLQFREQVACRGSRYHPSHPPTPRQESPINLEGTQPVPGTQ